jgi:N-acetylglucosamine kinase-like BadF-type ATPase
MAYFLGVDAGGTNTTYVLADDRRDLARVTGGTIKRMRANVEVTDENFRAALQELTAQSGVNMREVTRTCVGAAGFSVPLVAEWIQEAFARAVGGELTLVGDVDVALDAAFEGGAGVLVIAGTGSNVAGRSRDGRVTTAGGWGPALADQGSGHFIGLEALRRGYLAIDEQRESQILDRVMEHWRLRSLEELVERANARPAPDYSELSRIVVECAAQGDGVAAAVLKQGGEDLAYLVTLVIERMHRYDREAGFADVFAPQVAITGSILKSVEPVRRAMADAIQKRYAGVVVHTQPVEGVKGAVWRARQGN